MEYINQKQMILDYIKNNGSITVRDAVIDLGINALPTRIAELKKNGYPIAVKHERGKNRYGKTTQYIRYYIDTDIDEVTNTNDNTRNPSTF